MDHSSFLVEKNAPNTLPTTAFEQHAAPAVETGDAHGEILRLPTHSLSGAVPRRVADVHDLIETWNPQQQLYISGNVGLSVPQLKQLADALSEHRNWTVYLVEQVKGLKYTDPDNRSSLHHRALRNALEKGLASREDFKQIVDPENGEQAANILYITFDRDENHRTFGYIASDAYVRRGMGHDRWRGELDRNARNALRDGRRIYDAVVDSIAEIDREFTGIGQPGVGHALVATELERGNEATETAIPLSSVLPPHGNTGGSIGTPGTTWRKERRSYRKFLKQGIEELGQLEERFSEAERALAELSSSVPVALEGQSKREIEAARQHIHDGEASCAALHERARHYQHQLDKMWVFPVASSVIELFDAIRGDFDRDRLSRVAIIARGADALEQHLEELRLDFVSTELQREQIDKQLTSLLCQAGNPRVSEVLAREAGELRNLFFRIDHADYANDPVLFRQVLGEVAGRGEVLEMRIAGEMERYQALVSGIEKAERDIISRQERVEKMTRAGAHAEKLEKLTLENNHLSRKLAQVRSEIVDGTDSSWVKDYLIYSTTLSSIHGDPGRRLGYHAAPARRTGGYAASAPSTVGYHLPDDDVSSGW